MSFGQIALAWLLIGTCLLLMLVILLQRGRGGGLAGAFGGGGGSSAFGAKTGDVFTWITVILAGFFITLAVVANFVFEPTALASPIEAQATSSDVPAPTDAPVSTPVTFPLEEGQGIGKVELLTKDGKVIPIETKVIDKARESLPIQITKPVNDALKTKGDSGSDNPGATGDTGSAADKEGSDGGEKDPGK